MAHEEKTTTEKLKKLMEEKVILMFPAGLEPATFRVLGGRDNHYTTETFANRISEYYNYKTSDNNT